MAPMMDTPFPTTIFSPTTTKPPDSACSSWHPQVYRTLSLVFDFSNTDQKLWWHSTAPMFALMLQTANLGVHDQYKHLGIYKKHVIPFLGAYPSRTASNSGSSQDRWLSILTRYGIPFELSLNCSDSVVRYTYEPISEATGTETDPYNTLAIWDSLSRLVRLQPGSVDLEWFRYFKKELTLDMLESAELRRTGQAEGCIKTQNKLALDLKGGSFAVKVYIYPALKALVTARSMYDLIFGSVRKLALEYPGIRAAFDTLDEYVLSRDAQISEDGRSRALQPRLLSCDLVGAFKSRIKIYLLEQNVSLASLIDLWTLGGRRTDQATMDGLDLVCQLWDLLRVPAGWREYPAPYLPLGQLPNELLPFMANYTLHPNDDVPEPQVYFTVFGMSDSEVTRALTHFFERRGWTDMATKYETFLRESYPHDDFQSLNYLHTYISFSFRNNKPYLSVYLHSFESGNWPMFGESPTLFDACRLHRLPCKKVALGAPE